MIEVNNLCKSYGNIEVIKNISFKVDEGEIVGFLGPNGAGKTTTLNMLTGYLSSTSGDVTINGFNIIDKPETAKKQLGYLPDTPPVYADMTVREYLSFVCDLKGIKSSLKSEEIKRVVEMLALEEVEHRLIKNLSKGFRQRTGLAGALTGEPKVIILDEPTVGLDPKQIIEIRELIKSLGKKYTVLFSSHNLAEVSNVCDRVVIINKGEIVASGTPEQLSASLSGGNKIFARIKGEQQVINNALNSNEMIKSVSFESTREENTWDVNICGDENSDIREAVFYTMAENKLPILQMKSADLSLEQIFLHLTDDNAEQSEDSDNEKDFGEASLEQELFVTKSTTTESEENQNDGNN